MSVLAHTNGRHTPLIYRTDMANAKVRPRPPLWPPTRSEAPTTLHYNGPALRKIVVRSFTRPLPAPSLARCSTLSPRNMSTRITGGGDSELVVRCVVVSTPHLGPTGSIALTLVPTSMRIRGRRREKKKHRGARWQLNWALGVDIDIPPKKRSGPLPLGLCHTLAMAP